MLHSNSVVSVFDMAQVSGRGSYNWSGHVTVVVLCIFSNLFLFFYFKVWCGAASDVAFVMEEDRSELCQYRRNVDMCNGDVQNLSTLEWVSLKTLNYVFWAF